MKNINISDDAMKIILENAAWADFGLKVSPKQAEKVEESTEEVSEETEEHFCPLCASHLDEAISDEALMEHTANILEAVNAATLNEEEEEEDGEELYEEDESDDDENSDDEAEETEEDALKAKHGDRVGAAMYARGAKNIKKPAGKKK